MAYTPITEINDPVLNYFQWSNPTYPSPQLAAGISATDDEISFTAPPRDPITGEILEGDFIFGTQKADGYVETIYVPTDGMSEDGLTASGVTRGVRLGGLDYTTGDEDLAVAHLAYQPVFCNISAIMQAVTIAALTAVIGANVKLNGRMLFMGDGISAARIFANATARDAAITAPQNGDECYLTDAGQCYDYIGGSWQARASGVNPNASPTVAGKVEISTQTQCDDADTTGETGAYIVPTPLEIGRSVQKSAWTYAEDTGTLNALIFTLDPVPTALVEGFSFKGKVAFTNTLAVTANVNGLGVVDVTDKNGAPLIANDIEADGIYDFTFDGVGLQVSVPARGVGFASSDSLLTTGVLGDTFSASDITNNLNLAYQSPSDSKWYKITSTQTTWYYRLGLVCEEGVAGVTKRILLKGQYSNQSFSNINPTFSSALTGSDNNVGNTTANALRAILVDNSGGAEAVVTGGTISARQQGAPAGAMQIYLVLEQQDQTNAPAVFRDTSGNVARGAIIASTTIAQALFSGTYQSLSFSFGGNIKIPAGQRVYLVVGKTGAADAANYYQIQSNAATYALESTTQTWSGTVNAGNFTLTVTSTSPNGYSVKAYAGSSGSYGLTPSSAQWTRNIGMILSSTTILFDPEAIRQKTDAANIFLSAAGAVGIATITTNFCPNAVRLSTSVVNNADTDTFYSAKGYIRGDSSNVGTSSPDSLGQSATTMDNLYLMAFSAASTPTLFPMRLQGGAAGVITQNRVYVVRLESGFHLYVGYPAGTGFISVAAAGYTNTYSDFELVSNT